MLVVLSDWLRDVGIGEDGQRPIWLRRHRAALEILEGAEPNVVWRITNHLEQLRPRVFAQHPLAKGSELFPFVATVLEAIDVSDQQLTS